MQKNKEYLFGIAKIFKLKNDQFFLKNYLDLIKILNPNSEIEIYPGSSWLEAKSLRKNDRLHFFEFHTNEFLNLKNIFLKIQYYLNDDLRPILKCLYSSLFI